MGELGAAFRCAECGEVACVIRMTPAGRPVDLGPPVGFVTYGADGASVDLFGGTAWRRLDTDEFGRLQALVEENNPDAAAIRALDWELAPFLCRGCDLGYCWDDWSPSPVFDEGFYDETRGTCPRGHRQRIED